MRILVLCYEYPPVGGGGGRVAAQIAHGLAARGHTIRVLTSYVAGLQRCEESRGVLIRRLFARRRSLDHCSVFEMACYVVIHAVPTAVELMRARPDVVHVHFAVPSGVVAWFATRLVRVPYVLTVHLGDVPGGVPEQTAHLFKFLKPATVPIWRAAATVTAVAPHVAELAERAYSIKPDVILNGSDTRIVRRSDRPVADRPLRILWCGRIQKQKNLGPGIEALSSIAGLCWTLDVVGDGPLRAEAEETCRSAGLTSQVRFHGWLEPPCVAAELAKADVLYLPSLTEGLSLVTVEALRAGLAFVASRIPGITDVVTDGENGMLCDPHTPSEFAGAFAELIRNRAKLRVMQEASIARAPRFDVGPMVLEYEKALLSVASCRPRQ